MFGMLIPAACMTSLHLLDETNVIGFLIFLTLCMTGHQLAATGGYYFSHNDLAGPFSGTLFGITNTMAQIPGFSNALLVATLTPNVGFNLTRFYTFTHFHRFLFTKVYLFREQWKNGWRFLILPASFSCLDASFTSSLDLVICSHGPKARNHFKVSEEWKGKSNWNL